MYGARLLKFKCSFLGISSSLAKRPVEWMRPMMLLCVTRQRESLWTEKPAWEATHQAKRVPRFKYNVWKAVQAEETPACYPFSSWMPSPWHSLELCWDAAEPLTDGGWWRKLDHRCWWDRGLRPPKLGAVSSFLSWLFRVSGPSVGHYLFWFRGSVLVISWDVSASVCSSWIQLCWIIALLMAKCYLGTNLLSLSFLLCITVWAVFVGHSLRQII